LPQHHCAPAVPALPGSQRPTTAHQYHSRKSQCFWYQNSPQSTDKTLYFSQRRIPSSIVRSARSEWRRYMSFCFMEFCGSFLSSVPISDGSAWKLLRLEHYYIRAPGAAIPSVRRVVQSTGTRVAWNLYRRLFLWKAPSLAHVGQQWGAQPTFHENPDKTPFPQRIRNEWEITGERPRGRGKQYEVPENGRKLGWFPGALLKGSEMLLQWKEAQVFAPGGQALNPGRELRRSSREPNALSSSSRRASLAIYGLCGVKRLGPVLSPTIRAHSPHRSDVFCRHHTTCLLLARDFTLQSHERMLYSNGLRLLSVFTPFPRPLLLYGTPYFRPPHVHYTLGISYIEGVEPVVQYFKRMVGCFQTRRGLHGAKRRHLLSTIKQHLWTLFEGLRLSSLGLQKSAINFKEFNFRSWRCRRHVRKTSDNPEHLMVGCNGTISTRMP
ncbi:hypothetical protein B0H14DRAFT_3554682, partial [Mycena olivaceomarginata]